MTIAQEIVVVVLAAGQSKRMGAPKQLLRWGERTILATTLHNIGECSAENTLVVTGGYAEQVAAIADAAGVPHLFNAQFAEGEMVSSLRVAVSQLGESCAGIVVALGDMPFVEPETFDAVVNAIREAPNKIVVPTFEGKRGHPVGFGRTFFAQLLALTNDQTPRDVIVRNSADVLLLPVATESIVLDVDTKEAYERLRPQ